MRSMAIWMGALVLIALASSSAMADIQPYINYQGHLTDTGGTPLDGVYELTFKIYRDSLEVAPLWTEIHPAVPVDDGLFSVILGGGTPLLGNYFRGTERWLGITVGHDPEIQPRMRFTAVPWAFRSQVADSALVAAEMLPHDHDDRYYLKTELNTPGTINNPSNPVDWTKLKGMPSDFADGVDDVGSGGGLELPYQGQASTTSSAFWVRNSYPGYDGAAIRGEHQYLGSYGELGKDEFGVYGSSKLWAVYAHNDSTSNVGILGTPDYGVYGYSASGWAGYLNGKVYCDGYMGLGTYFPQTRLHVNGDITVDNTIKANDADGLAFATTGGIAMKIQDSGWVGIGTSTPETPLHVNGTMTLDQKIIADDSGGLEFATDEGTTRMRLTDAGFVGIGTTAPLSELHVVGDVTVDNLIKAADADGLYFGSQGGYAMRIADNGYVGIGTTTPETRCHIEGALTLDQTLMADDSGGLEFATDEGTTRMVITDLGRVGIGTTAPETPLHVEGGLTVDQTIVADDAGGIGFATDDGGIRMQITDDGDIGIGTSDPGGHQLYVKSSDGGASGTTLYCENDNTTNGIAAAFDNESDDVTVLMSQHGTGDILRCDSWTGGWHWVFKVENDGRTTVSELVITGGSDLSENFDVHDPAASEVEPGMVVSIDPVNPGKLAVSREAYDRRVAGVVSGAGGVETGMVMGQKGTEADGDVPVALTGRVYCWADASYGAIEPGDLLTSSSTPGHAMKVTEYERSNGAILGKAMSSLGSGRGLVLVLVTLQ